MDALKLNHSVHRYSDVTDKKASGATYTPKILADFTAKQIISAFRQFPQDRPIRILDPAVGDGQLLLSLLDQFSPSQNHWVEVHGFETDHRALTAAHNRLKEKLPTKSICLNQADFLEFVSENFDNDRQGTLFAPKSPEGFDLIISNPPYVRTQIMGSHRAQIISQKFGLSGRIDLYYAFMVAMTHVLKPKGIAGIIVSNRFMFTRSGAPVRRALLERCSLRHIWDFGDSKLFDAAILPAVLLIENGTLPQKKLPKFSSIYEASNRSKERRPKLDSPVEALSYTGRVEIDDGRQFIVRHGKLSTDGKFQNVWRIATESSESWLATVRKHTWKRFGEVGRIRVGVKTCADKVFIRSDWHQLFKDEKPELLRHVLTHHIAHRFRALDPNADRNILYPHTSVEGESQAVDLSQFPVSRAYLESHRNVLESRRYLQKAGRAWYEIWVPHDPAAWNKTKLVFRDISKEPTFWIDQTGSVVNGDCYWMVCNHPEQTDLLWLATAVANSSFIEKFYDICFHNKLYAGRRRFITQYVKHFPLPNPDSDMGKEIISSAKRIYASIDSAYTTIRMAELEQTVWKAFGLSVEEANG